MAFHQIREALEELHSLHCELAESYKSAARTTDRPAAARMYGLIEREEESVCSTLKSFEATAPDEILSTWLQYMPDSNFFQIRRRARFDHGERHLDEIVEKIVSINEDLRKLYRQLASVSSAHRIQELFTDIEMIQLAKISRIATSALPGELVAR